ncbi:MAG: lipid A deacylase LpxR family protein [Gammaproteobacteria bacterium]
MIIKSSSVSVGFFLLLGLSNFSLADDNLPVDPKQNSEQQKLPPLGEQSKTFRFDFTNDLVFGSDNVFTDGWSAQWHSASTQNWDDVDSLFSTVGTWGKYIPGLTKKGLHYRSAFSVGQYMQTPSTLTTPDLIPNDVPYAGALIVSRTWYAFNDDEFRGFEANFGVVGPASLAEQSQEIVHKLTGSTKPEGWNNQLDNQAIINFGAMYKKKVFRTDPASDYQFDAAIDVNAVLGNLFTAADLKLESRFGYNMPKGFTYTPSNIGRFMLYDATLPRANPKHFSLYGSLQYIATANAHTYFFDADQVKDNYTIESETFVEFVMLGVHYLYKNWGAHFTLVFTSDVLKKESTISEDTNVNYGDIVIEYYY